MRKYLITLLIIPLFANAQVIDHFADGDFTNAPTWHGDSTEFQISTYSSSSWSQQPRLQLKGVVPDISYLYVDNQDTLVNNYEWDFWVRLAFNTSTSNNCRVYLMSDNKFLEGSLNGYFVMFGDDASSAIDSVSICRQTGTTVQKIIHGHVISTAASGNYRIKVTRSAAGLWSLFADPTGGQNLIADGSATDNTFNITTAFGLYCKYTSTNKTAFYFDDIYAGPGVIDSVAPTITSLIAISSTQLDIRFSEIVEQGSAETISNYLVNSIGNPLTATKDLTDGTLVHLTFGTSFIQGLTYTLTTQNVTDLSANPIAPANLNFAWYIAAKFDVVINEIMADPDPPVGLPNFEYIELHNNTHIPLSLKNWKLSIGTSKLVFPEITIAADSFLLVMKDTASSYFSTYGVIAGFPSLSITNTGTTITLRKEDGTLIHSVSFTDSWYLDNNKKSGGWSLEQIDPQNPCAGASNWRASNNQYGGTPGHRNSVNALNPDVIPPVMSNAGALTPLKVKINFSESVDSVAVADPAKYSIDNGIGAAVSVVVSSPDMRSAMIYVANTMQQSIVYTITFTDTLRDCAGNVTVSPAKSFALYEVKEFDVEINELMADPDPPISLPNIEYVELYNRTIYPVSLIKWKLKTGTSIKALPDVSIAAGGYLILCPAGSSAAFASYGNTAEVSGLALTNGGELISLLDTNNRVISFVNYSDTWISNSKKVNGGWSLEQKDPNNPCGGKENWDASVDAKGGTPGALNSISGSHPDIERPKLMRASVTRLNPNLVHLYFNEAIDSNSLKNMNRYYVDHGVGNPVSVKLYGPENKHVLIKLSTPLQYDIIYNVALKDSIKDCVGNMIADYSSARVALPYLPDSGNVIINEVMYYPKTGCQDYVEVYNRGQKVHDMADLNLSGFDLGLNDLEDVKTVSEDGFLIFPGDYVTLTSDPEAVRSYYITSNPDQFISMSMPSYSMDSGTVVLSNKTGTVIDYFHYTSALQFPLLSDLHNVSLERINFDRPASDKTNWHSAAKSAGYGTPAYKNSEFQEALNDDGAITLSPEIFSPDGDGYNDVLNISYKFEEPGLIADITVYDERGRTMRTLVHNERIEMEGTVSWDGITDANLKGNIGIYIVYVEITNLNGQTRHYKKAAVLATKL